LFQDGNAIFFKQALLRKLRQNALEQIISLKTTAKEAVA